VPPPTDRIAFVPAPDRSPSGVGRTIDHYLIEAPLGKGGMGLVYRARDIRLGRAVALKLLPPDWTQDPDRRRRFLQEARAACAVNHPALTQIYDVGEDQSDVFITMELVDGRTAEALIQGHELDLAGTLEVAIQLASGLQKAHEAGIVHRDIKPANVMVTPDGHAKLLDFGLARWMDGATSGPGDVTDLTTLARTQAGLVVGTLGYMSPEQARGLPLDRRSDIFSFGVLMYEMTSGQRPFLGATALDVLHAIAYEEAPPLARLRPGIPADLERAVTRCLKKSPDDRYRDCTDLLTDLGAARREIEKGHTSPKALRDHLRDGLRTFREIPVREQMVTAAVAGFGVVAAWLLLAGAGRWSIVTTIGVSLFVWRRLRHRHSRLARQFTRKAGRLAEVRLVARDGMKVTVVTQQAVAHTYVRLSALLDAVNSSMFFGDPFTLVVRDGVSPEEAHALLASSEVLYSRDAG
jgi:serine/threonine protein kinase